MKMMIRDKFYYENRINLLLSRGKENGKIIAKLRRQLRNLEVK